MELSKEEILWLYQNLRNVDFFSDANKKEIDLLLKTQIQKRTYKPGHKICKQGAVWDAFYMIYSGKVSVSLSKGLLGSRKVKELGPGEFFGEMALASDDKRTANVIARESTVCFVIFRDDFKRFVSQNRSFAEKLYSVIRERKYELDKI